MPANQPFTIKQQIHPSRLDHTERAFELDGGEKVAVRIVQHESADEGFLTMMVEGRLIDDIGETALEEGVPVVCPPRVRTINKAALAEGRITIEGEMAEATSDMVRQVKNNVAAIRAWQKIPAAPKKPKSERPGGEISRPLEAAEHIGDHGHPHP